MNMKKSSTPEEIKASFNRIFDSFSEEEKLEQRAKLLAFKFLSEVEKAMDREGITRKELAKRIGTSASYITQLFRGDRLLNFNTMAKMEQALGLDFEIKNKSTVEPSPDEIPNPFDKKVDSKAGFWVYHVRPNYSDSYELVEVKDENSILNLFAA